MNQELLRRRTDVPPPGGIELNRWTEGPPPGDFGAEWVPLLRL